MKKSRRDFLLKSSLAIGSGVLASRLPPVEKLVSIMSQNFLKKAIAANDSPLVNYVSINLYGAPARWCFDQMLQTKDGQNILPNPMVATRLVENGATYTDARYSVVDFKGVKVPWLWSTQVASAKGGSRPLNDLLKHMIVFRGYGTNVDGHPSNFAKQTNPVSGAGSVGAHVADHSAKIFRALQFPPLFSASGFSSIKGTGLSVLFQGAAKTNYAATLMQPFTSRTESKVVETLRKRYSNFVDEAQDQIRHLTSQQIQGLNPLNIDFDNSLKTLADGIQDLDNSWTTLYQKYEKLVMTTIKDRTVPGLSDLPVIATQNTVWQIDLGTGKTIQPNTGSDIRDWYNNVSCEMMISTFALAEFVLTRGYGSTIELSNFAPSNLIGFFDGATTASTGIHIFDQHAYGKVPTTYMNSVLFRSLGSCLLELMDQLKSAGEFEKTFFHMVQEFGRIPRNDGTGSDHGFNSMISSLITGCHDDRPIVLGNISKGDTTGTYTGTFGNWAPTNVGGSNLYLGPAHVTSTIANLMQFTLNPWGNVAQPLIVRKGANLEIKTSGEIV